MGETSSSGGVSEVAAASRTRRGLSKARFEAVYSTGKRVGVSSLRLISLPGTGKVGFAVAKAAGTIARRNRLKRRAREAFRDAAGPAKRAYDYVVAVSAGAADLKLDDLTQALRETIVKLDARWENESDSS